MKHIIIAALLLIAAGLKAEQADPLKAEQADPLKAKSDAVRGQEIADLKWGMFVCWSMASAINAPSEWVRTPVEPKQFTATDCDTDQWCRTAKEAGMGYILFLTKHHDGFCLWDTKTTTLNVMNSPLKRDVLAELRKSCDKYGIKLALYFSEGDWSMDRKKASADEQATLKKSQLKELLTQYGPVEFISFDHAQGIGGLNHRDTDKWVRQFQPDCFSGFNNGEAGGRISLRERGTPGPIGKATAMANQMANEQSFVFTVAEFNYPINRTYWFFNTGAPEYPNLPAVKLYSDYCGAVKYGNIFSLDVGPNLVGKLRDLDVQTIRQVGFMIKNLPPSPPASAAPVAELTPSLIPGPVKVIRHDGIFALTGKTTIRADEVFAAEAAQLAAILALPTGSGTGITLKKIDGLAAEGYSLEVTPVGVTIAASTPAGAFYGCQTLRQLVTGKTIPCVSIQDAPRIPWRGFMLDVSRQYFDKEEVKTLLDQMAVLKLNVFHWHLTDDHGWRIEIKRYPKLTAVGAWRSAGKAEQETRHVVNGRYGGFYTQDDVREVVAYAAARHIQVIPEIDMPGHMSAAVTAYPELSPANGWTPVICTQGGTGVGETGGRCAALCIGRTNTVEFCKNVLTEVLQLFPSKEIHIGGDEVFYDQWTPCPDMQALKQRLGAKDWEEVQVAFGNEIVAFLSAQGRTAICWNNIYRQTVDKRAINHFWRSMGPARDFANSGYDVFLSPYVYYFDHGWKLETAYRYDPLAIGVKPEAAPRIRGICGCAWTPGYRTLPQLYTFIYPRLIAIAETGWTPQGKKDWDSFKTRLLALSPGLIPNTQFTLTTCKKATASNVYQNNPNCDEGNAVDGAANTRWATDAGTKQAWLEVDLGKPETFYRTGILEAYPGRVKSFELQAKSGDAWRTFYKGTTVGADFSATFEPITAQFVRLNILYATEAPSIWEFQLFPAQK